VKKEDGDDGRLIEVVKGKEDEVGNDENVDEVKIKSEEIKEI
jgi:hypothetical protein